MNKAAASRWITNSTVKAILIVLDSVGIGAAPDAGIYGDEGAATLPHLAQAAGGLQVPTLQAFGLGNIPALLPGGLPITGCPPTQTPLASWGAMQEVSHGKDTITGHWELAGLDIRPGFHLFQPDYPSFPAALTAEFEQRTGRKIIGNKAASGTAIIDELGAEQLRTGAWIAYTSADSVFQIAANLDLIPLEELYAACEIARALCDPLKIGRVIARPFRGTPGNFHRTAERRDYAYQPEEPTLPERLTAAGIPVYAVGKIEDIYVHRGITASIHTPDTASSEEAVARWTREKPDGLIFANYIDFDMLYGHRRDAPGYARALEQFDRWLTGFLPLLSADDLLLLTADHGNDPTFKGTDHTREYVPLLAYRPGHPAQPLGIRHGFYDVSATLTGFFGLPLPTRGQSFLTAISNSR